MKKISILIVHPFPLVANALRFWFNSDARFNVHATSIDNLAVLDSISGEQPDAIVIDIASGPLAASGLIRHVNRKKPGIKIICISSIANVESVVPKILKAGASCFVSHEKGFDELASRVSELTLAPALYSQPDLPRGNLKSHRN